MEQKLLFYNMLMIVSIGIFMKLLEMVFGHSRKDFPYELLGICTLVHVNNNFPDEGPLNFSISG